MDISANTYERREFVTVEMQVATSLGFRLSGPTCCHFLGHFLRAAVMDDHLPKVSGSSGGGIALGSRCGNVGCVTDMNPKHSSLAWYLSELALLDYRFVSARPSLLAAAIINLSRQTLFSASAPDAAVWPPTLAYYARYSCTEMAPIVRLLRECHFKAWDLGKYEAVRNKYNRPERHGVSGSVCCLPVEALRW